TEEEIRGELKNLPGWSLQAAKLHKQYRFDDFVRAVQFMATAAVLIEKMNHHPEWSNVYNRVTVDLTTHDAGGVTARDIELARVLEECRKRVVAAQ
ncbi:MAG: 4a-hydroxytetrahydrobiopterin dehydratase, partial [Acidobacteriaceae bacterium]|nr:4a-hydroxytetrahydrobiopterin dehydratase [Acidobacteriaceae bacterium]